jgi:hypothetical protein
MPVVMRKVNVMLCPQCLSQEHTILDQRQDLLVCQHCGQTSIPSFPHSYTRSSRALHRPRTYSDNFCKRSVHFKNWLKRLQGKERRRVPGNVIDAVRNLLQTSGTRDVHYWVVRSAVKQLGFKRYYANIIQIMTVLRGHPLVSLTKDHEEKLLCMFLSLRDVYDKVANERINMLHYAYVIRKLCEVQGWDRMARCIPLLKSSSRIQYQDLLWKKLCDEKGWTFIPTVLHSRLDTRNPYATRI